MKLHNQVTIKQTITPATIQLLEMVQMNTTELSSYLTEQAMENPAIDIDELGSAAKSSEFSDKVEWLSSFGRDRSEQNIAGDDDTLDSPIASRAQVPDVRAYLLSQLLNSDADCETKKVYRYLIGCVDSRGFLSEDWGSVSKKLGVSREEVENCVAVMRSLPPKGICARDVRGCLAAQLGSDKANGVARSIVENHLEELSRGHYAAIAKALNVTTAAVRSAEKRIKRLYPYPSSAFEGDRSDDSIYVSPDIIISASDEGLNVSLCHPFTPHLRISSFCSELKKSSDDPDVLKYVEERISAAGRLYQNVCKYEETLLSCFGKLARLQSAFFYGRTNAFKPMTLADIADSTGLSVSTVSRAMRGKYIQCSRGVIPAKLFFSAKLEGDSGERSAYREHTSESKVRRTHSMIYEFESKRPKIDSSAYISDSAIVIGDVTIGARCYVGPGAVIRGDERPIWIGDESAVEDLCVIHVGGPDAKTDGCHIGKRVTIGHGAMVHGNYIRDGANIGMGAIVSLFADIGEYAVVAEGAVVKKHQTIPPRVVVGGAPAKVLRELEEKDIYAWERSKQTYIDLAARCKAPVGLKRID